MQHEPKNKQLEKQMGYWFSLQRILLRNHYLHWDTKQAAQERTYLTSQAQIAPKSHQKCKAQGTPVLVGRGSTLSVYRVIESWMPEYLWLLCPA